MTNHRSKCSDCGKLPPAADTLHSLFGARHGWRLTREDTPDGEPLLKLRCAACWHRFKESGAAPMPPSGTRKAASTAAGGADPAPTKVRARDQARRR